MKGVLKGVNWSESATLGDVKELLVSVEFDEKPKSPETRAANDAVVRRACMDAEVESLDTVEKDGLAVSAETRKLCQELLSAWSPKSWVSE